MREANLNPWQTTEKDMQEYREMIEPQAYNIVLEADNRNFELSLKAKHIREAQKIATLLLKESVQPNSEIIIKEAYPIRVKEEYQEIQQLGILVEIIAIAVLKQ